MFCKNAFFAKSKYFTLFKYGPMVHSSFNYKSNYKYHEINPNFTLQKQFFSYNLSPDMKIVLKDIIEKLNKVSKEKISLMTILSEYGTNKSQYQTELLTLLSRINPNSVPGVSLKFECGESKIWNCNCSIENWKARDPVIFSGIGISKQTAERNCLLTVLLYLNEINGLQPHFNKGLLKNTYSSRVEVKPNQKVNKSSTTNKLKTVNILIEKLKCSPNKNKKHQTNKASDTENSVSNIDGKVSIDLKQKSISEIPKESAKTPVETPIGKLKTDKKVQSNVQEDGSKNNKEKNNNQAIKIEEHVNKNAVQLKVDSTKKTTKKSGSPPQEQNIKSSTIKASQTNDSKTSDEKESPKNTKKKSVSPSQEQKTRSSVNKTETNDVVLKDSKTSVVKPKSTEKNVLEVKTDSPKKTKKNSASPPQEQKIKTSINKTETNDVILKDSKTSVAKVKSPEKNVAVQSKVDSPKKTKKQSASAPEKQKIKSSVSKTQIHDVVLKDSKSSAAKVKSPEKNEAVSTDQKLSHVKVDSILKTSKNSDKVKKVKTVQFNLSEVSKTDVNSNNLPAELKSTSIKDRLGDKQVKELFPPVNSLIRLPILKAKRTLKHSVQDRLIIAKPYLAEVQQSPHEYEILKDPSRSVPARTVSCTNENKMTISVPNFENQFSSSRPIMSISKVSVKDRLGPPVTTVSRFPQGNQKLFHDAIQSIISQHISSRPLHTSQNYNLSPRDGSNVDSSNSTKTAESPNDTPSRIIEKPPIQQSKPSKEKSNIAKPISDINDNIIPKPDSTRSKVSTNIKHIFPLPKQVLNNMFNTMRKPINISYSAVKIGKADKKWECTYRITWPEDKSFKFVGFTKKIAADGAAYEVLDYLYKNKKISKKGEVIVAEDAEVQKTTRELPSISFNATTMQLMKNINFMFKNEFSQVLDKAKVTEAEEDFESTILDDTKDYVRSRTQRFLGTTTYLAKEKVKLPISDYKDQFIEILKNNRVVIVKGEPGCGKSTRIPQYTLESWAIEASQQNSPCKIAVTQPRRIAATSLAERVAKERDESVGNIVGFKIRLRSNFQNSTGRILYCTTGILLRIFQSDQKLSAFSHVILDEAHEREVETDILMNLLKTALENNPDLKVIVMSATIDTEKFSQYFGGAPILEVPGKTYPVKTHFLDMFNLDLSRTALMSESEPPVSVSKLPDLSRTADMCMSKIPNVVHKDVVKLLEYIHKNRPEGAILVFLPGWEDISQIYKLLPLHKNDIAVYRMHSKLQDDEQWRVFSKPPPGVRKIILSTNIAETSVTIDDVVYVVDTGIRKEKRFDCEKGIDILDNFWISKASAAQRAGRAGRVRPGECFRLYLKDDYQEFPDFTAPEILCTSLTRIVLQAKQIGNNINAHEFMNSLLTPPEKNATEKAVEELIDLELLDEKENMTPLGRKVAEFQLEPKLGKVLINSIIFKCITPVLDIITLFSSEKNIFASNLTDRENIKKVKKMFCNHSDHLSVMRIFEKWLELVEEGQIGRAKDFCREMCLAEDKLNYTKKLVDEHLRNLKNTIPSITSYDMQNDTYSDNDELVKATLYSGVGTVLQHRNWDIVKNRFKKNVNVLVTRHGHKATITMDSINFKRHNFPTKYIFYIYETRSNLRRMTVVRECSLIPAISVLLFTNKDLEIKQLPESEFSAEISSKDQIKISISGTSIQIICDRQQAEELIACKNAIRTGFSYYVNKLTQRIETEPDGNADRVWNSILELLNRILEVNRILSN